MCVYYIRKYFKYRVENRKRVFPIFIDPADRKFIAVERIKGIPTRSRLCQNRGVVCARHHATVRTYIRQTKRRTSELFFFLFLYDFFHLYSRPDTVCCTDRTHIEVCQIPSSHRTVILVSLFAPAVRSAHTGMRSAYLPDQSQYDRNFISDHKFAR